MRIHAIGEVNHRRVPYTSRDHMSPNTSSTVTKFSKNKNKKDEERTHHVKRSTLQHAICNERHMHSDVVGWCAGDAQQANRQHASSTYTHKTTTQTNRGTQTHITIQWIFVMIITWKHWRPGSLPQRWIILLLFFFQQARPCDATSNDDATHVTWFLFDIPSLYAPLAWYIHACGWWCFWGMWVGACAHTCTDNNQHYYYHMSDNTRTHTYRESNASSSWWLMYGKNQIGKVSQRYSFEWVLFCFFNFRTNHEEEAQVFMAQLTCFWWCGKFRKNLYKKFVFRSSSVWMNGGVSRSSQCLHLP